MKKIKALAKYLEIETNGIIQLDSDKGSEQIIKAIQEQCENGNEAMLKLIDDIDDFIGCAIKADGRGHFLNTYDGEEREIELEGKYYYIYKIN